MSRYIDIETIKPRQYENSEVELGVLAYDYDEVDAMPFLDIVRCKDCAYVKRLLEPLENTDYLICHKYYHAIDGDDYCSYGVRQTERGE